MFELQLDFNTNEQWKIACVKKYEPSAADQQKLKVLLNGISLNYQHHWIIGN